MLKILTIILTMLLFFTSCSKNEDSSIKKKVYEPNLNKRLEQEKGKLLLFGDKKKNMDVFGQQNVMWRASMNVLQSLPLASVSYDAGIIITDWYSPNNNDQESIKIVVNIISSEVNINSINVSGFKKTCKQNACTTNPSSKIFNQEIKSKILEKTRQLSISDIKN